MIIIFNRGHPKWSSKEITFLLSSDQQWSSKEITLLFSSDQKWSSQKKIKKKIVYSQDQAMILQTSKRTFKRWTLRSLKLNRSRKFPKPDQYKIRLRNGGQLISLEKSLKSSINMDDLTSLVDHHRKRCHHSSTFNTLMMTVTHQP